MPLDNDTCDVKMPSLEGKAWDGPNGDWVVYLGYNNEWECQGNDTYGITGIPSMVGGRGVVERAGLTGSTRIVYPSSGREDA